MQAVLQSTRGKQFVFYIPEVSKHSIYHFSGYFSIREMKSELFSNYFTSSIRRIGRTAASASAGSSSIFSVMSRSET